MEDFAMFDEVGCEEYYGEDWARWMDEMEIDFVNLELQAIADEQRAEEMLLAAEEMVAG
jgi:hypothetical protein